MVKPSFFPALTDPDKKAPRKERVVTVEGFEGWNLGSVFDVKQ